MKSLADLIAERIHTDGPLPFSEYMRMALYEPGMGYYTSGKVRTGASGDFITSSTSSAIFGKIVGKQLISLREKCDDPFTILEFGAGSGGLCRAILDAFDNNDGKTAPVRYIAVDVNPASRETLKQIDPRVEAAETADGLAPFSGCILCHEFFDNMPVDRVKMTAAGLQEIRVDYRDERLCDVLVPAGDDLLNYFDALKIVLPEGTCTEVNLQANQWMKMFDRLLRKGFVMVIDYGYLAGQLSLPSMKDGTLACYYRHSVNHDPHARVGEQDITSHVNFSGLALFAHRAGFRLSGFATQKVFLENLGVNELLAARNEQEPVSGALKANFQAGFLLGEMGEKMKVLTVEKNTGDSPLQGYTRR